VKVFLSHVRDLYEYSFSNFSISSFVSDISHRFVQEKWLQYRSRAVNQRKMMNLGHQHERGAFDSDPFIADLLCLRGIFFCRRKFFFVLHRTSILIHIYLLRLKGVSKEMFALSRGLVGSLFLMSMSNLLQRKTNGN
jgi:hypothetical protein